MSEMPERAFLTRMPRIAFFADATVRMRHDHTLVVPVKPSSSSRYTMIDANLVTGALGVPPNMRRLDALMCEAFHGKVDRTHHRRSVEHINGIRHDDRPVNLRWALRPGAGDKRPRASSDATSSDDDDDSTQQEDAPDAITPWSQPAAAAAAAAVPVAAAAAPAPAFTPPAAAASTPPTKKQRPARLFWSDAPDADASVFQVDSATGQIVFAYASAAAAGQQMRIPGGMVVDRAVIGAAIKIVLDVVPCQAMGFTWVSAAGLQAMFAPPQ